MYSRQIIQKLFSFIIDKHNFWIVVFRVMIFSTCKLFSYIGYCKRNVHIDEIGNIDWLGWYLIEQRLIFTAASPQITQALFLDQSIFS